MMPLAHEAGGTEFHPGGKHWQTQNDPEWKTMADWVKGSRQSRSGRFRGFMSDPFRYYLRVRYIECDAQKVVFNSRYSEYVDVGDQRVPARHRRPRRLHQRPRSIFSWSSKPSSGRRRRASTRCWNCRIAATRLGTTSFTIGTEFRVAGEERVIVTVETVYVLVDGKTLTKLPLPDAIRAALQEGAAGRVTDHAAYQSEK